MSKLVHRRGDSRSCGASTTGASAVDVFVEGVAVSLAGDVCSHGAGALKSGQGTVFANNKLVVRTTDSAEPDNHKLIRHRNPSAQGCNSTVYCGNNTG